MLVYPDLDSLSSRISQVPLSDQHAFRRRLGGLEARLRRGQSVDGGLKALAHDLEAARERLELRRINLPQPTFPDALPVVQRRDEIGNAIRANQVVILCGETGSGKTTQLPKICLELGRGVAGMIGHTQPRRIATRSLAARVASELRTQVGHAVGYKMRFSDRTSPETYIKIMTDGILLAETQSDPALRAYDTLIIDEAHERSLNVDFLLGYLKRLLPERPELKLIITSATIDPESFAAHFDNAPIVEVSGRSWPVEIRYRPVAEGDDESHERDRQQALLDAIDELAREGAGDVLVFLPSEREIGDAAENLRKHHPPHTEIVPLYGRLSAAQQQRVFEPHGGRRIVLATNVAETSLTVPGIRYVVDTGLARISRYSYRTKVQRLPVEPVSQASANQRAGRCGRTASGICIRLYSEEDYLRRPPFTDPEILRTSLAAVILQMLVLRLGDIRDFPFLQPPDARFIRDGFKLLHELGAIDDRHRLADVGRRLARFPVDVRLARMLLAAAEEACLAEVLVIVSALAVQDPRERPFDQAQAADEKQRQFRDERSDFMALLELWNFYHAQARHLSRSKLRMLCREYFLSAARMREWHDIHRQLQALVKSTGMRINQVEADYAAVHRALLTGLLSNVAFKSDAHEFTGARNLKLNIFPGSGLFARPPKWIVAAELVETGRRYARIVATIEPQWVERLAGHLVKRHYSDPHWEKRAGKVAAYERVMLYGLVLVARRKVNFGAVDPRLAREIFIRGALVQGELTTRAAFFAPNQALLAELQQMEERTRRRDILVDEEVLFDFYNARIPAGIHSAAGLESWYRHAARASSRLLFLAREDLLQHAAPDYPAAAFPDELEIGGIRLALEYHFVPGDEQDGVTAVVPLAALNQLSPQVFDWLVPGLVQEKVTALIRSLPKRLRRHFVPAPDYARACIAACADRSGSLLDVVTQQLHRLASVEVPADAWQLEQLPAHLVMRFRVVDAEGRTLAAGRDLETLREAVGAHAASQFRKLPVHELERDDVRGWDFADLPEYVELKQHGLLMRGYPALLVEADVVKLRVLDDPQRARREHRKGLVALFRLVASRAIRDLEKHLPGIETMCLHFAAVGSCGGLREDLVQAIIAQVFPGDVPAIRSRKDFEARALSAERQLMGVASDLCGSVGKALVEYHDLARKLGKSIPPRWLALATDVGEQLSRLVYPGFVSATPFDQLPHLARYIKGIQVRLQRVEQDPGRDIRQAAQLAPFKDRLEQVLARPKGGDAARARAMEYRWLLEEFRISLFAQELGTARPVSGERLQRLWSELGH